MTNKNDYGISRPILAIITLNLFLITILTACAMPQSQGDIGNVSDLSPAAGVAIVYPTDGAQFQVGDFVDVTSVIADRSGVTAAVLSANSLTLRRDQLISPVAGGELYQPWVPDAPGTYVLQVVLETSGSGQHISDPITVIVGDGPTLTFTPSLVSGTPTITNTLDTSITPTFTGTPETPSITPTSDKATATGEQNSNCRKGPDARYDVQGLIMEGETVPIVGRNPESSWWVVELTSPAIQCWVWGGGVSVSGNTGQLTIVHPPKLPTFTFTPKLPTLTNTPKPSTEVPPPSGPVYNACHEYPDLATCNSDPAGFGNCTWDTGTNKCKP